MNVPPALPGWGLPLLHTARPRGPGGSTMTDDDTTKAACLYMLERGLAHPEELAKLSKRSRQIIRIWAQQYPDARAEFLKKKWAKALLSAGKTR